MHMTHGGDIIGFALRYGQEPIDFSASINPFGMPPAVRSAAVNALDSAISYPDPQARHLRMRLGQTLDVQPENIVIGAGAADIIHRLTQSLRPRHALITAPSFSEYSRALTAAGCRVQSYILDPENGFAHDSGLIEAIDPETDMVFLCQPCNPTGVPIPADILEQAADRCKKFNTLLCIDECFCGFMDNSSAWSLLDRARTDKNIFIINSFTKLYALAGLRAGWAFCADRGVTDAVSEAGQPWPVAGPALAAALAALDENEYVRASVEYISREKQFLRGILNSCGAVVFGSAANFIFFRLPVADLDTRLAAHGILIRNCADFESLEPGYWRIAVRLHDDNKRLSAALAAATGGNCHG